MKRVLILHPDPYVLDEFSKAGNQLLFNAKDFNRLATSLRKDFTIFIDQLSAQNESNVDWWATALASRYTYLSPTFRRFCYLKYAEALLPKLDIDEIICESAALANALRVNFSKHLKNKKIRIRPLSRAETSRLLLALTVAYRSLRFSIQGLKRIFYAVSTKKSKPSLQSPLNLIDVFLTNKSFEKNEFQDRYFDKSLTHDPSFNWVYAPTFYQATPSIELFNKMRGHQPQFLVKEDYLSISDFFWASLHPLRLLGLQLPKIQFLGLIVDGICQEDLRVFAAHSFEALLQFRFYRNLKASGFEIKLFVDWFENQSLDKIQNLALRRFFPKIKLVGYQGYYLFPNCLCTFPSPGEEKANLLPHVIASMGQAQKINLSEFNKNMKALSAPAYRTRNPVERKNSRDVLVVLPMANSDVVELLNPLAEIGQKLDLIFQPHPAGNQKDLLKMLTKMFNKFQITNESILKSFETAGVVISTNSGAAIEAVTLGIPTILIGSRTQISFLPFHEGISSSILKVVYGAKDLESAIGDFSNKSELEKSDLNTLGKKLKAELFYDPESTEKQFLSELHSL